MLEEEAERMREEAVRIRELTNQIKNDLRRIRSYGH
jgi:two-component sensor histidine kinase